MENGSQRMLVKVSWIWETKGILPKNENLMNILIVLLGSMLFIARVRFDVKSAFKPISCLCTQQKTYENSCHSFLHLDYFSYSCFSYINSSTVQAFPDLNTTTKCQMVDGSVQPPKTTKITLISSAMPFGIF